MRAVGTGTHPEGRYIRGQVFDLPAALDGSNAVHPDYASIIENGWAVLQAPADDPGRTPTQIANALVRGDALSHPVDAALADLLTEEQALAITHTGDPTATREQADPHEQRGSAVGHRGNQLDQLPGGTNLSELAKRRAEEGKAGDGTGNAGDTGITRNTPLAGGAAGDRGTAADGSDIFEVPDGGVDAPGDGPEDGGTPGNWQGIASGAEGSGDGGGTTANEAEQDRSTAGGSTGSSEGGSTGGSKPRGGRQQQSTPPSSEGSEA